MSDNIASDEGMERPDLDAWNVTNNAGESMRIIVGEWFNSPQRIEINPDDLIEDPDARSLHDRGDSA